MQKWLPLAAGEYPHLDSDPVKHFDDAVVGVHLVGPVEGEQEGVHTDYPWGGEVAEELLDVKLLLFNDLLLFDSLHLLLHLLLYWPRNTRQCFDIGLRKKE